MRDSFLIPIAVCLLALMCVGGFAVVYVAVQSDAVVQAAPSPESKDYSIDWIKPGQMVMIRLTPRGSWYATDTDFVLGQAMKELSVEWDLDPVIVSTRYIEGHRVALTTAVTFKVTKRVIVDPAFGPGE